MARNVTINWLSVGQCVKTAPRRRQENSLAGLCVSWQVMIYMILRKQFRNRRNRLRGACGQS